MKRVLVTVSATGAGHDLEIQPGTTAADILRQIGLQDHQLKMQGEDPFGNTENVYPRIADGEKLFANSIADVGGGSRVREAA